MPTLWPHVLVEDGPAIAGVRPGTAIAFAPGDVVSVSSVPWENGRDALVVASSVTRALGSTQRLWRVAPDVRQLETQPSRSGGLWGPADGDVVHVGEWRLRFVLDGAPLATPRRFGMYVGVHARTVGLHGGRAFSEWIIPSDGAVSVFFIEESVDGTTFWRMESRRTGVALGDLRALAGRARTDVPRDSDEIEADLDVEIAAGIVSQMVDVQPRTFIGFDGIVRAQSGTHEPMREERVLDVFAWLTRGPAYAATIRYRAEERTVLEVAMRAARAAPPAEIGALVRSLAPDAWEREQALVEECGVFAE